MLSKWLERRKGRKNSEAYKRGFEWAMSSYYLDHMTVEEIDAYACGPYADHFEFGVREAIRIIAGGTLAT